MERKNVLVYQSLPDGYKLPKDLLCFLEVLRRIDAEGLESHWLVVQSTSPDVGGSTRCHGNFSTFLDPSKQSDGVGE